MLLTHSGREHYQGASARVWKEIISVSPTSVFPMSSLRASDSCMGALSKCQHAKNLDRGFSAKLTLNGLFLLMALFFFSNPPASSPEASVVTSDLRFFPAGFFGETFFFWAEDPERDRPAFSSSWSFAASSASLSKFCFLLLGVFSKTPGDVSCGSRSDGVSVTASCSVLTSSFTLFASPPSLSVSISSNLAVMMLLMSSYTPSTMLTFIQCLSNYRKHTLKGPRSYPTSSWRCERTLRNVIVVRSELRRNSSMIRINCAGNELNSP